MSDCFLYQFILLAVFSICEQQTIKIVQFLKKYEKLQETF